jgi:diadenosine tetraphosphate (Ap4A) HIT family hydrolase
MNNICLFCKDVDFQLDLPAKVKSKTGYSEHGYYLLMQTKHSFAIVGYGAITPGYILLIPSKHYETISQITGDELEDFLFIKSIIYNHIKNFYGGVVFFEHGALSTCRVSSGACIDHAHLHCIPDPGQNFDNEMPKEFTKTKIASINNLHEFTSNVDRYLFLENKLGEKFVYQSRDPVPPQFFRRIWAKIVGKPEEFDFVIFPEFKNMLTTYENFSNALILISKNS